MKTTVIAVTTSPHLHGGPSVDTIMRNVVYALLPLVMYAVWLFGLSAAALITTTTLAAVGIEWIGCRVAKRENSVDDWSAVITGMLLGLILPPGLPLWMGVIGAFVAVAPGKLIFGGLGFNVFNPALVGRAFLQAAFPVAITSYSKALDPHRFTEFLPSTFALPLMKAPALDAMTAATPLVLHKFDHVVTDAWSIFWGVRPGSAGESSVPLILLCGAYLVYRQMMEWRIPVSMLLSAYVFSAVFHWADPAKYPDPLFMLFSGGLVLGATFMATDPVASPVTPKGMWIYGMLMGLLTVLIRLLGGLAEGVMYSILLGNAVSPLIDRLTAPRTYGERKPEKAAKAVTA